MRLLFFFIPLIKLLFLALCSREIHNYCLLLSAMQLTPGGVFIIVSGATGVTFRNYIEPPLLKSWIRPCIFPGLS